MKAWSPTLFSPEAMPGRPSEVAVNDFEVDLPSEDLTVTVQIREAWSPLIFSLHSVLSSSVMTLAVSPGT